MKITDFNVEICKENVLHIIDCYPDSPIYEEVLEELDEMLEISYEKLDPVALLEFGSVEQYDMSEYGSHIKEALYCINSVGGEMSEWSTKFFDEGNYLKGMLADAVADDYLFQMDHQLGERIIQICKERNCGVIRRLEAPQDIPMKAQKTAWELTKANEQIGLEVKESYMYDPIKSTCQIYLLEENSAEFRIEHDCSKCANVNCKMRNLQKFFVTIQSGETSTEIEGKERQSLMEILQSQGIYLNAVCAGRGTCGKCKVQMLEGIVPPSNADEHFFTEDELERGYRLACKCIPNKSCTISLNTGSEQNFEVITSHNEKQQNIKVTEDGRYGIAVDIGTTTIAMQLVELEQQIPIDVYTAINRQRAYGADVISRMEASNSGKAEVLRKSICEDLQQGIRALLKDKAITVERMVIGANTTMVHLLRGYSCKTLGVYPFTPVNIDTIEVGYGTLFGCSDYAFDITIFPGISTYVGGDIVAGLYACEFDKKEKTSVLIDLGTNGEMAIGCAQRILVTSTAAGPAFEGGNITHGIGSVPGAICNVSYDKGEFSVRTIGNRPAIGICGTGVIDVTCELVKAGVIDETGLLEETFFNEGISLSKGEADSDISFYQKDIREIQLGKSAVRAGLETLLIRYGVGYDEIDTIYIAGGFGYKMDIQKAVGIGLLPQGCDEKIIAIGNSSLNGAFQYLVHQEAKGRVQKIVDCASEINLSNDKNFNEFYMEYMYFDTAH